jgi:hypothetical protein
MNFQLKVRAIRVKIATKTPTGRSVETISSALVFFIIITVLLAQNAILRVGPLQVRGSARHSPQLVSP